MVAYCVCILTYAYGLGEISLSPYLSDEERQRGANLEQGYLDPLIGKPVEALLKTAEKLAATQRRWGGLTSFALKAAFLDLQARQNNHALAEELGGQQSASVDSYFSISERDNERIQQRLRIAGAGGRIAASSGTGLGIRLADGVLGEAVAVYQ